MPKVDENGNYQFGCIFCGKPVPANGPTYCSDCAPKPKKEEGKV